MSLIILFITSFMIALSGALVPGPLFTFTIAESARRGSSAGPLIILGHGILELFLVTLIVLGLTPFLAHETFRLAVSVMGGTVLGYMGFRLVLDARSAKLTMPGESGKRGIHPVLTGIVGSASNPYWILWWATIGVGYLLSALKFGMPGVIVFFAGHISADLMWYTLVSVAVSKGRKVIGDRGYRLLLGFCGFFLISFGLWFILSR